MSSIEKYFYTRNEPKNRKEILLKPVSYTDTVTHTSSESYKPPHALVNTYNSRNSPTPLVNLPVKNIPNTDQPWVGVL